eukprot:CAMPEP_0197028448 /NCGR_PEP_ID=MMETSP1384-20130603/8130_1 /TAXON_ID=29189 /ORGANISM="Ammonia sp." /LENGTH=93 /DNA_ID=CAMNT_0042457453 /DNA_START=159 /DNA_END=440 /DNA_ORIENTATION=+
MSQPKPAQKVGGVRHKAPKQQPKTDQSKETGSQPPIDPLLNTQPKIQGQPQPHPAKNAAKPKAAFAAQKLPEPKQHASHKQNNPKINQPKQGY